jgi:hypothetical protein
LLPYSFPVAAEAPQIHIQIPPHFGDCKRRHHTKIIPIIIIKMINAVLIIIYHLKE